MDYIMIRAWCQYMGSENYYVRDQIATAREDKVPHNVIYKRDDGIWATIEDVKGPARPTVERIAAALRKRENPDAPYGSERTII